MEWGGQQNVGFVETNLLKTEHMNPEGTLH